MGFIFKSLKEALQGVTAKDIIDEWYGIESKEHHEFIPRVQVGNQKFKTIKEAIDKTGLTSMRSWLRYNKSSELQKHKIKRLI